jgi:ribosome-binding protein aMBF1 (putative translation factor)
MGGITVTHTRNFVDVIRAKLRADPELADMVEEESFNADLASKVYELRTAAGLSQKQLAELVGTQQSVISRIEDADYDGHSLKLLRRIAKALSKRIRIEFYACASHPTEEVETFTASWKPAEVWNPKWPDTFHPSTVSIR